MRPSALLPFACLMLACAARSAGPGTKSVAQDDACFGGTPEVIFENAGVTNDPNGNGTPLLVAGGNLLWQGPAEGPELVSLATRKPGQARLGNRSFFKTADEREVYNISWDFREPRDFDMDLVAVDIATGKSRTVVAGGKGGLGLSPDTHMALDGDYVYFIRPTPYGTTTEKNGFFRARRDGTGKPKRLGAEPEGMRTPFLIHDGYVYWNRDNGKDGAALWRRALAPESPVERLASTKDHHLSLFIDHGRLYYADLPGIFSVPLDGSAPPALLLPNAGTERSTVIADAACVYWTQGDGIFRSRLGKSGTPERIADETTYRGGPIVTDGQRLYWKDLRRGRILGMGRAAGSLPERPVLVAKPIDGKTLPADAATRDSVVLVGDGWGCAKVYGWNQPHWQCWNAGGKTPIKARSVPGLSAKADPAVGADKLCFLDGDRGKCWSWTELAHGKPSDFLETQVRKGRLGQWLVGGDFSCLLHYVGAERMLACSGDDAFDQLAQKEQPVALERWHGALGASHGCVSSSEIRCWGRGDAGQLGRMPETNCTVAGKRLACDANLGKTDFTIGGVGALFAGDMFTCASFGYPREIRCWGGSRDGWFGDTPCPPELRQAWPVGTGFAAAPKATCSTMPARIVEPGSEIGEVSVGPRGVCLIEDGKPRCLGAIATPSTAVTKIAVGKGAQANACGIDGSRVVCWGEGYSPAEQPGLVVPVAFEPTIPASAVVDFPAPDGTGWPKERLIHRGCSREPVSLPTCDAKATGESWASLLGKAESLAKQRVSVRDRLVVGPLADAFFHNERDERWIVVGANTSPLHIYLPSFRCDGDESRLCCGAPAFGQTVIATGVLTGSPRRWGLKDATVCEVAPERERTGGGAP
jgi:hypothetical protein